MPLPSTRIVLAASLLLALLAAAGCGGPAEPGADAGSTAQPAPTSGPEPADERPREATDLFGEPLYRPVLPEDFRTLQEELLAEAEAAREADPESLEAWVWVGRRQAYLGRYGEAVATYTEALDRLGELPELYRHRGHRYLTTRRYAEARADFERAAGLIEGQPDRAEADGLPNDAGIPTSTLGTNVWYHLGLARYLLGEYAGAEAAYRRCLELSTNPDMEVATLYWLYLALKRLGEDGAAARLAEGVDPQLELLENHAYHRLLLLFHQGGDGEDLLAAAREEGAASLATNGYGVGSHRRHGGDSEGARSVWEELLEAGAWASFGYLAAEAEMSRPTQTP